MAIENIHFISGLPRSGSTLLGALLQQNPRFHAGMSSSLAGIVAETVAAVSCRNEYSMMMSPERRGRIIEGIFASYYRGEGEGKITFDTSRKWSAMLALLRSVAPSAWCICCVRNIAWIADSFERVVRSNPTEISRLFSVEASANMHTRVDQLMQRSGAVGKALSALSEGFYGEQSDRLVVIRYETLVREPIQVLRRLYDLLGERWFEHDTTNVAFEAEEFDRSIGAPGLHRVRSRVEHIERQTVLPPSLFSQLSQKSFWDLPSSNPRNVSIW